MQFGDVEVHAAARVLERIVIVERPQSGDDDGGGSGPAVDCDVIVVDVESGRAAKARGPLCGRLGDVVSARLSFLYHFIRLAGPVAGKNLFGILKRGKDSHRHVAGSTVGEEVRGRRVFKVRHVHGRGAVERVESHIQRMPWASELKPRILQRMRVFGDRHFVIEPPAPFGFTAEEVVDHALHDLAIRPRSALDRVFKLLFPLRPAVFLAHGRGRFKNLASGSQGGGDLRPQLAGERGNGLLDVDVMAIHLLGAEEVRELLKDVIANHGARAPELAE